MTPWSCPSSGRPRTSAGSYYMEDGVLCLQSGTRFTLDEESGFIESEDDVMFPSQLPANLQ